MGPIGTPGWFSIAFFPAKSAPFSSRAVPYRARSTMIGYGSYHPDMGK